MYRINYVNMKIFNNKVFAIGVILFLGLLIITWFRGDFIISRGEDSYTPFHPEIAAYANIYVWSDISTGTPTPRAITLYPIIAFFLFLSKLGFSIVTTQKIFFYIIFIFTGLSMYYLVSNVLLKNKHFIGLLAGLLYMFNIYNMHLLWGLCPIINQLIFYSMIPLLLGLYIKGLENKRVSYAVLMCITSLLVMYNDPAFTIIMWAILGLYYIFYAITNRHDKSKIIYGLKFSILTFAVWIGLNLYWIVLMSYFFREGLEAAYKGVDVVMRDVVKRIDFVSSEAYISNALRLFGHIFFNTKRFGTDWYPYADVYFKPSFILMGFLVPILAFSSLLFKSKHRHYLAYFALLAIISIFLSKGSQPPFGEVYPLAAQKISFLQVFRTPLKFITITALTYSIMIAITFYELYKILINQKHLHKFSVLLLIPLFSILMVYVFPMWSGEVIVGGSETLPSARIKIPEYYSEAYTWIKSQNDSRVFTLPFDINAFDWKYGALKQPKQIFHDLPLISKPETNGGWNTIKYLNYDLIMQNSTQNISKSLALLNVKYVLVFNDEHAKHNIWVKPLGHYQSYLKLQKGISLEKSFSKLDFYKNEYWRPLHIYSTSNVILIDGSVYDMVPLVNSDNFVLGKSVIFLSDDLDNDKIEFIKQYNNSIFIDARIDIPTYGSEKSFDWSLLVNNSYIAISHEGWRPVIRTDGTHQEDSLSFSSLDEAPYKFPSYSPNAWNSLNSTLVYIKTGLKALSIYEILENGEIYRDATDVWPQKDIVGAWWETGWVGMGTKEITFPIVIPPNQKAILQICHNNKISPKVNNISIISSYPEELSNVDKRENKIPNITFQKINPTKYRAKIQNATQPFFLVFSESYHSSWKAYLDKDFDGKQIAYYTNTNVREYRREMRFTPADISYLFTKPLSEENHFLANGYANAWYIDPNEIHKNGDGEFTITLYFWPQSLSYLGLIISGIIFMGCISYLIYGWKKNKRETNSK